ncbi:hypothetical protein STCU_10344 [Strigomonas culicis]|uniref:Uncharacterized protein n=1 Tax=Strigomonas culicis TaxID=28005 RepID=S9V4S1_9TRYP|nr:hypothetical protein STCU_10344 [Strigomonas culicis]|eukprot:EPY17885.1 hypothetical protein STCU_10344 [Strigomonas culicis]
MASYSVNDEELLQLNVGDFVGVMTHHMGDNKIHWTLGSVESPPYLRDVEIRLWEKQRGEYYTDDVPATEETEGLMNRIAEVKSQLQDSYLKRPTHSRSSSALVVRPLCS